MLRVEQLCKRFGDQSVVRELSFALAPGECLGVIGPNGAGKTTTLRMCLGLVAPDSGAIRYTVPGHAQPLQMPADALTIKQHWGVVAQNDTLDPDFTCGENLLVFGRYFGLPDAVIRARIPELLEFASLTHKADAKPAALSGGHELTLCCAPGTIATSQLAPARSTA